jgi:muconolactone delta-isomerase
VTGACGLGPETREWPKQATLAFGRSAEPRTGDTSACHLRPQEMRGDEEKLMEFLVEFELDIPNNVARSEVEERERAESIEADALADQGRLVRLWKISTGNGPTTILGLYRADSRAELDELLGALPLYEWMRTSITPLVQHPNDPVGNPSGRRMNPLPSVHVEWPRTGQQEQFAPRTSSTEDPAFGDESGGSA